MWRFLRQVLRRLTKSAGERVMTRMAGVWGYTGYAGWSHDRTEQVRHFRGWNYVAIRAICEEVAGMTPQVALVQPPEEVRGRKSARYLPRQVRTKALTAIQPHEELELVDSDHPLMKLLKNPNGPDVAWSFFYKLLLYLELTGNAYVWVVPDTMGMPAEMYVIPAHWVTPHSQGKNHLVDWYEVRPYGGLAGSARNLRIPADEMIHIAYPHPWHPLDGYAPGQACAEWIDILESADKSQWFSFKQGANPGAMVEFEPGDYDPDPAAIDRFKADFQAKYAGEYAAGIPLVLPVGATAKPWKTSPAEMDYVNSGDQKKNWVLAIHRVGQSIVGLAEQTNFAAMVAATANFCFRTIKPKLTFIGQVLTEKLARRYDDRLCVFWPDSTPDDPAQKLAEFQAAQAAGAVTPNEWRTHVLKLDPFENGGDDPLVPPTLAPMPLNTGRELDVDAIAEVMAQMHQAQQGGAEQPNGPGTNGVLPAADNGAGGGLPSALGENRFASNGVSNGR